MAGVTRTDPERWANLCGGDVEWVRTVLPRVEELADRGGKMGREWTAEARALLCRFYRERWRDERQVLEAAQRRIEKRGRRNASSTVDVGEALRRMMEPR